MKYRSFVLVLVNCCSVLCMDTSDKTHIKGYTLLQQLENAKPSNISGIVSTIHGYFSSLHEHQKRPIIEDFMQNKAKELGKIIWDTQNSPHYKDGFYVYYFDGSKLLFRPGGIDNTESSPGQDWSQYTFETFLRVFENRMITSPSNKSNEEYEHNLKKLEENLCHP